MLCFHCLEVRATRLTVCPECGEELVVVDQHQLKAFVDGKVERAIRARVGEWQKTGVVEATVAGAIIGTLGEGEAKAREERQRRKRERKAAEEARAAEAKKREEAERERHAAEARSREEKQQDRARRKAAERARAQEELRRVQARERAEMEAARRRDEARDEAVRARREQASAEVATEAAHPVAGALAALAELDADPGGEKLKLAVIENLGWFIGALLVLAGSIYGVREAWLAFGAVGRYASVGGAALMYHGAFVGLSALLARRSPPAGRVLSGIGVALLPVAAVAFTHLFAADRGVGMVAAGVFLGVAALTLMIVARRFELPPMPLWSAFLPSLAAMIPLASLSDETPVRFALALVGIAAYAWSARITTQGEGRPASLLFVVGGAAYAAVGLEVLALTTSALDDPSTLVWRTTGVRDGTWLAGWLSAFAAATVTNWTRPGAKERFERLAIGSIVSGVGLATVAAVSAAIVLLDRAALPSRSVLVIGGATAALAAYATVRATFIVPASHYMLLPLGTLAAAIFGRAVLPQAVDAISWVVAAAIVVEAGLLLNRSLFSAARRWPLRGIIVALMATCVYAASSVAPPELSWTIIALGMFFAAGAHAAAFSDHVFWHYVGGLAAVLSVLGAAATATTPLNASALLVTFGALYGLAAAFLSGRHRHAASDLALLVLGFASMYAFSYMQIPGGFWLVEDAPRSSTHWQLGTGAAVLLLWRSFMDRSPAPAVLGGLLLAFAGVSFALPQNPGETSFTFGAMALGFALVAALFRAGGVGELRGDGAVYFIVWRSPFSRRGRAAVADGVAIVALVTAAIAVLANIGWFTAQREGDRSFALDGGFCVLMVLALAFFSRAFSAYELRGNVATLWTLAAVVAVVAVTNRIGRPLPPHVVALNLSVIGVLLWAAAVALHRYGPAIGRWLGEEGDGYLYHWIPHAGAVALASLLVFDAWLVGNGSFVRALSVTPPLFAFGPALIYILFARTTKLYGFAYLSAPLIVIGAGLLMAEGGHLVGPVLRSIDPPSGPFMPPHWLDTALRPRLEWLLDTAYLAPGATAKMLFGAAHVGWAIAGLFGALVLLASEEIAVVKERLSSIVFARAKQLTLWLWLLIVFALGLGLVTAFSTSWPTASLIAIVAAVVAAIATRELSVLVPLTLLAAVHADAMARAAIPAWSGPLAAFVAWLVVAGAEARYRAQRRVPWGGVRFLAALALVAAIVYALAYAGQPRPLAEAISVIFAATLAIGAPSAAALEVLCVALAMTAIAAQVIARQAERASHRKDAGSWASGAGFVVGALALSALFAETVAGGVTNVWSAVLWQNGFLVKNAAAIAAGVLVAHLTARVDHDAMPAVAAGERWARDGLILVAGAALAMQTMVRSGAQVAAPGASAIVGIGIAALIVVAAVSAHAAWKERSSFHLYVVQTAIVGAYGLVRAISATALRPEHDALFALCLGFLLVGVTVLARRHGVEDVAKATRRFAALLPVLMLFVLPWQASFENALFAAGAGALYSTLGWIEHSRIFGTFGAVCVNVGLFVVALWQGANGIDVYLAPLGLFVLALGHLFARDLPHSGRTTVRFIGSFLLYAPAMMQIVLEVGNAADPMYAFMFAGVCLLGIGLGMLLEIRAYLVLGTMFLFTDVVAGLVRASQRSQRVGFFVLSVAGLSILGGMVLFTVKKAEITRWANAWRRKLRTWD